MLLKGKTVIVSGVGPGLGREVALAASREGANVVLGARREEQLKAVADEVDPAGTRVAYRSTDITDTDEVQALVDLAAERFGAVDGIVNVAAQDRVFGGIESTTEEQWREVIGVNVIGTMNVIRSALPLLKERGGSIVNIGSTAMLKPAPGLAQMAYGTSKGALLSATYYLADELGPHRIRVNLVAPGWMWGPPVEMYVQGMAAWKSLPEEEVLGELQSRMALPDLATDGDVAETAVFLLSDRAKGITGQSLLVNAGETLR